MAQALTEAKDAKNRNEIPVGCIIVDYKTNKVIAATGNQTEEQHDPTAHAEIQAIRLASQKLKTPRLANCDLYVTLEPCPMCATAISFARIRRVYYGAYDPKGGGIDHGPHIYKQATCHHKPEVYGGIHEQPCSDILKDFFKNKR